MYIFLSYDKVVKKYMLSSEAVAPSFWHGIVAQISCSQLDVTFFFHVLEIHLKILLFAAPEIIWILRQQ